MGQQSKGTGQLIREYRKAKGLTQGDLGAKLGVTASAVMRYETEQRNINLDQLKAIADALEVDVLCLLGATEPDTDTEPDECPYALSIEGGLGTEDPDAPNTPQGWLLDAFNRSNEDGQKLILDIAQAIAGNPAYAADYPGSPANRYSTPTE